MIAGLKICKLFPVIFGMLVSNVFAQTPAANSFAANIYLTAVKEKPVPDIFDSLILGKYGLGRVAYDYAMLGYNSLKQKGLLSDNSLLTIIDFSLSSAKKRLFVLDLKKYKLLFVTYAAHGRNTGTSHALHFSNEPESFKSSVGFYLTMGTYTGQHGYSLKLRGYEAGFNDNAEERAIVMHSAEYVSEALIKQQGYIGRSLGCPALSPDIYKQVIAKIQNKTCLFVYGNDGNYIGNSKLLKQRITLKKNG
ncbi:MAG: murein L,D-transpeptidase catalytic domain family protein [Ferruginibacter sp.]